jgi:putative ABC transport system permease protein
MSLIETFTQSLKNIMGSKMRTFLTMLGIIIGVTAVIVIVGLGNGMENYMRDQFASLGTNSLTVMVTGRNSARSVSVADMYDIVDEHRDLLDKLSPTVSMQGVKVGSETLSSTSVTGVSEDYFAIKTYSIAKGRGLQYMDIADRKSVCVVGSWIDSEYYGGEAVGETIRVAGAQMRIVGVMSQEDEEPEDGGTDDCVYLPYSTAARLSRTGTIRSYTVTVVDEERTSEAKRAMENALFEVFGDSDAYSVISMSEILDVMTSMLNIVIVILAIIAAISLVVGGIGIMNIMLVSVTERTREIGIRKALGAKERTIMQQFVMEAATISAMGGVLGIGLGYLLSAAGTSIIRALMDEPLTVAPSVGSVALAVGVSAGIGVLFGWLPARKAARLNPIDALRYE